MLENALNLLPYQFKNLPNWESYLASVISQYDILLDGLKQNPFLDIENSTGKQLDMCGNLVGIGRGLLTDEEYKQLIKKQIILNGANGTSEGVITFIKNFLEPSQFYYFHKEGNIICFLSLSKAIDKEEYEEILTAIPSGMSLTLNYTIKGEITIKSYSPKALLLADSQENSAMPYLFDNNDCYILTFQQDTDDISKCNFTQGFGLSDGSFLLLSDNANFMVESFSQING